MWHDIEAEVDLLNFGVVARAAADLIRQADGTAAIVWPSKIHQPFKRSTAIDYKP